MVSWWKKLDRERKAALVLIFVLVCIFGFMLWMIGQAAHNQSVPRLEKPLVAVFKSLLSATGVENERLSTVYETRPYSLTRPVRRYCTLAVCFGTASTNFPAW